jgi:hypothetical protein
VNRPRSDFDAAAMRIAHRIVFLIEKANQLPSAGPA